MNVGVDDSGKDGEVARIDLRFRRTGEVRGERDDLSVADPDVVLAGPNEQIEIAHEENDEARMTKDEGMTKPE